MPTDISSPTKVRDAICKALAPALAADGFTLAPGGKLLRREGGDALWPAISIGAMKHHGAIVVDPCLDIYWPTFMEVFGSQLEDLGYASSDNRNPPCIVRAFSHLSSEWEDIYVDGELDIARGAQQIIDVYQRFGRTFVEEWGTPECALAYLDRPENFPGTWAPTLKFLLIEAVRGRSAARAYLDDPTDKISTIFERRQIEWLRSKRLGDQRSS